MSGLRKTLMRSDVAPVIRRFFINTLFDSTFILLGIVVGASYAIGVSVSIVIVTMLTSSLALGISSGVSVYEAESLERARSISELEKALFRDLSGTRIERRAKYIVLLTSLIIFSTPLVSCAVTILPFLLAALNILDINVASWCSVALALTVLFGGGVYIGRAVRKNPLIKGFRMVCLGLLAFLIGFFLNSIV